MMETAIALILALVVLALVLEPLVRGRPWPNDATNRVDEDTIEFTDLEESESAKIQALLALREIEFDKATGKLSDEDYLALKTKYQQEALVAIQAEDVEQVGNSDLGVTGSAEEKGQAGAVCPMCGPRPESTAQFCSDCGRELTRGGPLTACPKCGEPTETGAKFCGECGVKL